jgi:hypothetical protein
MTWWNGKQADGRKRKEQKMVACFGSSRKPDRCRMGQLTANCGPEMGVATAQGFDGGELLQEQRN